MEIFEILDDIDEQKPLQAKIRKFLEARKAADRELSTLIEWGFRLVTYHKQDAGARVA